MKRENQKISLLLCSTLQSMSLLRIVHPISGLIYSLIVREAWIDRSNVVSMTLVFINTIDFHMRIDYATE